MAKPFEIIGTVKNVMPEEMVGRNKDIRSQKVVVETNDSRPDIYHIECTREQCNQSNMVHVGDSVKCECWINGREWTNQQGKVLNFVDFRLAGNLEVTNGQTGNQPDPDELFV